MRFGETEASVFIVFERNKFDGRVALTCFLLHGETVFFCMVNINDTLQWLFKGIKDVLV